MHYDMLAQQSLRLGFIWFTGSQGTAGQLMKAFLNKMICKNNTATVAEDNGERQLLHVCVRCVALAGDRLVLTVPQRC